MAEYELEWAMYGTARIEADDEGEAEHILHTGLASLDVSMFDEFDVDQVETTGIETVDQSEDR